MRKNRKNRTSRPAAKGHGCPFKVCESCSDGLIAEYTLPPGSTLAQIDASIEARIGNDSVVDVLVTDAAGYDVHVALFRVPSFLP